MVLNKTLTHFHLVCRLGYSGFYILAQVGSRNINYPMLFNHFHVIEAVVFFQTTQNRQEQEPILAPQHLGVYHQYHANQNR